MFCTILCLWHVPLFSILRRLSDQTPGGKNWHRSFQSIMKPIKFQASEVFVVVQSGQAFSLWPGRNHTRNYSNIKFEITPLEKISPINLKSLCLCDFWVWRRNRSCWNWCVEIPSGNLSCLWFLGFKNRTEMQSGKERHFLVTWAMLCCLVA